MLPHKSFIILTNEIEEKIEQLKKEYHSKRIITFFKEKFLIDDAKEVISQAYISEADLKYIIVASYEFNIYSQNSLLKVLEEPPQNIVFIIITQNKSSLLPTIRSRLPIVNKKVKKQVENIDFDFKKLDLSLLFDFVTKNKNISKNQAKELVGALYKKAFYDGVKISQKHLDNFDLAYKNLELNGRVQNVLTFIMMGFLYEN